MKLVIRTFIFHLLCIIIFALLYLLFSEDLNTNEDNKKTFLDFLLLSTTIQAGVGISSLYPISYYTKIIFIIQQLMMLLTHVITLYIFTL